MLRVFRWLTADFSQKHPQRMSANERFPLKSCNSPAALAFLGAGKVRAAADKVEVLEGLAGTSKGLSERRHERPLYFARAPVILNP